MKFSFTIYLFAKIFNFNIDYAGSDNGKKIHQFFNIIKEDGPILTNTIKGKNKEIRSPGRSYFANKVIVKRENIEHIIDETLLRYAYEKFIGPISENKDISSIFSELLIKSLEPTQEQQSEMYTSYNDKTIAFTAVKQIKQRTFDENTLSHEYHCLSNESEEQKMLGYLKAIKSNIASTNSVQLAFQAGSQWLQVGEEKYSLLIKIATNNIPIRVIINELNTANKIGEYMRDPVAYKAGGYTSFSDNQKKWISFASQFKSVQIRECPLPLMRTYSCFTTNQFSYSKMRVSFYTYGETDFKSNFHLYLTPESPYFMLYENEFNYLWQKSKEIPSKNNE